MRYLLDVNVLIALGHLEHGFHERVAYWLKTEKSPELLTCSITELGFVRILSLTPSYGFEVGDAQSLLRQIKQASHYSFRFVADGEDATHLPNWVKSGKQTTDGHLMQLAGAHGAVLRRSTRRSPRPLSSLSETKFKTIGKRSI